MVNPFHNVTIGQITEALARNGLEHLRGTWLDVDYGTGTPTGGCILGQTGHNLGASRAQVARLQGMLNRLPDDIRVTYLTESGTEKTSKVGDAMVHLNDLPVSDTGQYRSYERLVQIWNAVANLYDPNMRYDAYSQEWVI